MYVMGGDLPNDKEKRYCESKNDSKQENLEWEGLNTFGEEEDDIEEHSEDPEECGEDKAHAIMEPIHDKLNDIWFKDTSEDEDDLEGIIDYL
ncbi:hypothetical protein Tco_0917825 [Tanacetum coccineum]